ncbi:uncharacterized mitochondrial protein AtMg00810-like [Spinacia oleracea]|uniref:Uncharacterized mitochondrial protein AtMg00810-like n=1 Tax=Spinacia oleracea TaxID=3562 RepID=A0ABM3QP75_SPIOL|nr:uncharacterized mitochondrial protein AtMg00810-like [Spinacia oleracea]
MKLPEGIPNPGNKVCRLKKSLYGLKQASRQWFSKLTQEWKMQGFEQSKNDDSLFIKRSGSDITLAAVYVDDMILTGTDHKVISDLKSHLHKTFSIKDLGILHYFLGIEVGYSSDGRTLTQGKFTNELLHDSGLEDFKPVATPLPLHLKFSLDEGELFAEPEKYRCLVGKLHFLVNTRPDLAYTVQTLSQFMHQPRQPHYDALVHTLRYIAATAGQGRKWKGSDELKLQAFSDSDWASCPDTRRSVTGYFMMLGNSPISWKSKEQPTVSHHLKPNIGRWLLLPLKLPG